MYHHLRPSTIEDPRQLALPYVNMDTLGTMQWSPLRHLATWAPFRLDALGLITLLGAAEVDRSLGQLIHNKWFEYLPLLAANVIASDSFTRPIPGSALYNITDGILATDVAGWFCRWLLAQKLTFTSTKTTIECRQRRTTSGWLLGGKMPAPVPAFAGVLIILALLLLTVLLGDWWGMTNLVCIGVVVVIRQINMQKLRTALDHNALGAGNSVADREPCKVFVTLPNGDAVTVKTTRGMVGCLLTTPRPDGPQMYMYSRLLCWLMFAGQALTLGSATLMYQILCVVLLIAATMCVTHGIGAEDNAIGGCLMLSSNYDIVKKTASDTDNRHSAYINLRLTQKEEDSMVAWNLTPHRSNKFWWDRHNGRKEAAMAIEPSTVRDAEESIEHGNDEGRVDGSNEGSKEMVHLTVDDSGTADALTPKED